METSKEIIFFEVLACNIRTPSEMSCLLNYAGDFSDPDIVLERVSNIQNALFNDKAFISVFYESLFGSASQLALERKHFELVIEAIGWDIMEDLLPFVMDANVTYQEHAKRILLEISRICSPREIILTVLANMQRALHIIVEHPHYCIFVSKLLIEILPRLRVMQRVSAFQDSFPLLLLVLHQLQLNLLECWPEHANNAQDLDILLQPFTLIHQDMLTLLIDMICTLEQQTITSSSTDERSNSILKLLMRVSFALLSHMVLWDSTLCIGSTQTTNNRLLLLLNSLARLAQALELDLNTLLIEYSAPDGLFPLDLLSPQDNQAPSYDLLAQRRWATWGLEGLCCWLFLSMNNIANINQIELSSQLEHQSTLAAVSLINILLKSPTPCAQHVACLTLLNLVAQLSPDSVMHQHLQDPSCGITDLVANLCTLHGVQSSNGPLQQLQCVLDAHLRNISGGSSSLRQMAGELIRSLIKVADAEARFDLVQMASSTHISGATASLLVHTLKEEVRLAYTSLNEHKEKEPGWPLASPLVVELLDDWLCWPCVRKENIITSLGADPNSTHSIKNKSISEHINFEALWSRLDLLEAVLNFIRFLLLQDRHNWTGIHDHKSRWIESGGRLPVLRNAINQLLVHFQTNQTNPDVQVVTSQGGLIASNRLLLFCLLIDRVEELV